MTENIKYYKRTFLNENEGMAAFEASINYEPDAYTIAEINITDCNRQISLDFGFHYLEDCEAVLGKLNLLITELRVFRTKMMEAYEATQNNLKAKSYYHFLELHKQGVEVEYIPCEHMAWSDVNSKNHYWSEDNQYRVKESV